MGSMDANCKECMVYQTYLQLIAALWAHAKLHPVEGVFSGTNVYDVEDYVGAHCDRMASKIKYDLSQHLLTHEDLPA